MQAAIDLLIAGLTLGIGWCGSKLDLAVDVTIKWAIPAAGGGYFALNPEKIEAVIEAAKAWVQLLH